MMVGDIVTINRVLKDNGIHKESGIDVELKMDEETLKLPEGDNNGDLARIMTRVNVRSNLDQVFARRKNDIQLQAATKSKIADNSSILQMYGGEQGFYDKMEGRMNIIEARLGVDESVAVNAIKEIRSFAPNLPIETGQF